MIISKTKVPMKIKLSYCIFRNSSVHEKDVRRDNSMVKLLIAWIWEANLIYQNLSRILRTNVITRHKTLCNTPFIHIGIPVSALVRYII